MKDQFFIVLPSNSSMGVFSDNTTTHFITQLPQEIKLQGDWEVALTEIHIPLTFQHISKKLSERKVQVLAHSNEVKSPKNSFVESIIQPGLYSDVRGLIEEINNLECTRNHLKLKLERGGLVTISRICGSECSAQIHEITFSAKLKKILGFESDMSESVFVVKNNEPLIGSRPANLSNALPSNLMVYSDILEPLVTGDVQARLLRTISLDTRDYSYGCTRVKTFSPAMYLPLLFNNFQTIELDLRDQHGDPLPFDHGTLMVILHFKRTN